MCAPSVRRPFSHINLCWSHEWGAFPAIAEGWRNNFMCPDRRVLSQRRAIRFGSAPELKDFMYPYVILMMMLFVALLRQTFHLLALPLDWAIVVRMVMDAALLDVMHQHSTGVNVEGPWSTRGRGWRGAIFAVVGPLTLHEMSGTCGFVFLQNGTTSHLLRHSVALFWTDDGLPLKRCMIILIAPDCGDWARYEPLATHVLCLLKALEHLRYRALAWHEPGFSLVHEPKSQYCLFFEQRFLERHICRTRIIFDAP